MKYTEFDLIESQTRDALKVYSYDLSKSEEEIVDSAKTLRVRLIKIIKFSINRNDLFTQNHKYLITGLLVFLSKNL